MHKLQTTTTTTNWGKPGVQPCKAKGLRKKAGQRQAFVEETTMQTDTIHHVLPGYAFL
jgi:hypothetical protein